MPLAQRRVGPVRLSRAPLHDAAGRPTVRDGELEAVSNYTLAYALRQLASVASHAQDLFDGLGSSLASLNTRSAALARRVADLGERLSTLDPKTVPVPVGDMTWYSSLTNHFGMKQTISSGLFTASSRPSALERLYEAAAEIPACRTPASVTVTPVLGASRRRAQATLGDIEASKPALIGALRRWTSSEALGSLTVDPDTTLKVNPSTDLVDHTLPSPEEQLNAIANKFPAEVVCVDVSGKSFQRMTSLRRSLMQIEYDNSVRRRKGRRPRGKRRNTIAGTDSKELQAIASESSETVVKCPSPEGEKKSHLESLKEWGLCRLRQLRQGEVRLRAPAARKWDDAHPHSSSGNWSASSESGHSTATSHHPRSSISSGSMYLKHRRPIMVSTSSSVTSESTLTPDDCETGSMYSCDTEGYYTSFHVDSGLKPLREEEPCVALQSTCAISTAALGADSEYELFGRGSTSTTASSAGTVCTALPAPAPPRRAGSRLSGNRTFPERSRPAPAHTHSLRAEPRLSCAPELTRENLSRHNRGPTAITVDVRVSHPPDKCGDSPDSGHNTCSSPVDSVASPDVDLSECSDLEGIDRAERLRAKTTINSSRIPSMCVITPPQSDDEVATLQQVAHSVDPGEYVTIAEVQQGQGTEYISLNDLPSAECLTTVPPYHGSRVSLDSEGKVVYASDSLKRKKKVHTTGTFEPGPCIASQSVALFSRNITIRRVRSPVVNRKQEETKKEFSSKGVDNKVSNTPLLVSSKGNFPISKSFPKSILDRISPGKMCRPVSPLVSKTPFSSSKLAPREKSPVQSLSPIVSRGAYVRMQQPSDDLSFPPSPPNNSCPDKEPQQIHLVKRSDSYRLANQEVFNPNSLGRKQYGPGVIASPSLLTALTQASNVLPSKAASEVKAEPGQGPVLVSQESPHPQSTSTPTKNESNQMDFTTVPSPIDKSPGRSAMDLFAIIHDSKKRIQSLQRPEKKAVEWPKAIPGRAAVPQPMGNLEPRRYTQLRQPTPHPSLVRGIPHLHQFNSLPRMKLQQYNESPRCFRRTYTQTGRVTSSSDFRRLLLQSGSSPTPRLSAAARLGARVPPPTLSSMVLEDRAMDEASGIQPQPSATIETSL